MTPQEQRNQQLDDLIAKYQPTLRQNNEYYKMVKELYGGRDKIPASTLQMIHDFEEYNTILLAKLFDQVKTFYDLLYMNYAFLSDKLDGGPEYTGRFGEGDGVDHIGSGAGLRTMTVYGLLTVNGQSNSTDKIDIPESPFYGQYYTEYSMVTFLTTKTISEKLFPLLKTKKDLFIVVKTNKGIVHTTSNELIHSSVYPIENKPNENRSDLTVYDNTQLFYKRFYKLDNDNVTDIIKDLYMYEVGINPFRPRDSRQLATLPELENVENIINRVLTDPLNKFKQILLS
jgi:hypothetical protein